MRKGQRVAGTTVLLLRAAACLVQRGEFISMPTTCLSTKNIPTKETRALSREGLFQDALGPKHEKTFKEASGS